MTIAFACPCGKSFQVPEQYAGKRTKCSACGSPLVVPTPPAAEPDDGGYEVVDDAPAPAPLPVARAAPVRAIPVSPPAAPPSPLGANRWAEKPARDDDDDRPAPRKKKKKRRPSESSGGGGGGSNIAAGLLMMVIAVVWLVVGLVYLDRFFCYPPFLFVFGIIAIGRGMMGIEDD